MESRDPAPGVLVAVTDHAAERFRQRVGGRLGLLDVRPEISGRVARAWAAGRVSAPPPGDGSARGTLLVRDVEDRDLVFVCRHDPRAQELVVITLWEEERLRPARVPRRFTDALDRTGR